jgi:hypothetical protein
MTKLNPSGSSEGEILVRAPRMTAIRCDVQVGDRCGQPNELILVPAGRADVLITATLMLGDKIVGGQLRVSVPVEPMRQTTINLNPFFEPG